MAHHRGALTISGTADRIEVIRHANAPLPRSQPRGAGAHVGAFETTVAPKTVAPVAPTPAESQPASAEARAAGPEVSGSSKLDAVIVRAQTKAALVSLGWTPSIATAAVAAAAAALGAGVPLERLIREALRRCPMPGA